MANVRSMMSRGHRTDFEDGYRYRTVTIARNIVEALAQDGLASGGAEHIAVTLVPGCVGDLGHQVAQRLQ